jgi:hypothetical protein
LAIAKALQEWAFDTRELVVYCTINFRDFGNYIATTSMR